MSEFSIPLSRVMVLERTLENGGTVTCKLQRPEASLDALVYVENDTTTHHIKVTIGPYTSSLALPRNLVTKCQTLRFFLQDLANGRADSAEQPGEVLALLEVQASVDDVLMAGQTAYVITTVNRELPFGVVVTNDRGEVCAAVTGSSKEHLAAAVHAKLQPGHEGLGECA